MTKKELGSNYFKSGYNCAQSVVLAFKDELGMDEKTASTLSAGFGGGFGRLREVCGAVSGMVMVISTKFGYYDPLDNVKKMELYKVIQLLVNKFKEINGSYICRELMNLPEGSSTPVPEERTETYYKKRPCAELVGIACDILDKYFKGEFN